MICLEHIIFLKHFMLSLLIEQSQFQGYFLAWKSYFYVSEAESYFGVDLWWFLHDKSYFKTSHHHHHYHHHLLRQMRALIREEKKNLSDKKKKGKKTNNFKEVMLYRYETKTVSYINKYMKCSKKQS